LATDVPSATITATATTGAFTPLFGVSSEFILDVTAISGTNATLSVAIEESWNAGTSWRQIHTFPTIGNAPGVYPAGMYKSGLFPVAGNRYRYVQTIAGTTPSFTRSIVRSQLNTPASSVRSTKRVSGTALGASLQLKSGQGYCHSVSVMSSTSGYLMLFDATAAPADGAVVPIMPPVQVVANQICLLNFGEDPLKFDLGLVAALSSTNLFTKTALSTGFFGGQVS
jgi:hypothetical protein